MSWESMATSSNQINATIFTETAEFFWLFIISNTFCLLLPLFHVRSLYYLFNNHFCVLILLLLLILNTFEDILTNTMDNCKLLL